MLQRLTINISDLEQEALEKVAAIEIRDIREQARFMLRQCLEQRGLLQIANPPPDPQHVPGGVSHVPQPN